MNIQSLIPWGRGDERVPAEYGGGSRDPFLALYRDMNRLFDDAFRNFGLPAERTGGSGLGSAAGWPSLEIHDGETEMRVTAEVPGTKAEDLAVELVDNVLTLRGEKRSESEDSDRRWSERFYGRFERRVPLPVEVEADKVTAGFENGVLTIILPKSPRAQSNVRRIEIGKSA